MRHRTDPFIPALGLKVFTPLYDPLLRWVLREDAFKRQLLARAALMPGQRVLDLGCGTGTLTLLAQQASPGSQLVGLDIDPAVLRIARRKVARAGSAIVLHLGRADRLPYRDQSFDLVISSLMLHHLTTAQKQAAFAEVYRVLKPGGRLHIVDFGPPHTRLARIIAAGARHLEQTADNIAGRLPQMMRRAGFAFVEEPAPFTTAVGALAFYAAQK